MSTNMTGFRCFSKKYLCSCALDGSSRSIGRLKTTQRAAGCGVITILKAAMIVFKSI